MSIFDFLVKTDREFGIAVCVALYWFVKDWMWSKIQIENQTKIATILEIIQRDGVKCKHDETH